MKSKQTLQSEAKERQATYDALSKQDKLALIEQRRGESEREKNRLLKGKK